MRHLTALLAITALVASAPDAVAARRPKPKVEPEAPSVPPDQVPEEAPRDTSSPQAPTGIKRVGLAGTPPVEGKCPDEKTSLVARGSVLRMGPGPNFGVHELVREDRCFPVIRRWQDGAWLLIEIEQGRAGWHDTRARPLAFGNPPALPRGEAREDILLTEEVIFQAEPSLVSAITGQGKQEEILQVHAVSEDGLFFLCARDGQSVGWVLKSHTRNTLDLEAAPGGSKPWAPPPRPLERLPEGSPDLVYRDKPLPTAPKPADKPADKATTRPADKAPEAPADKPADPATATPADKPSDKPADAPADKPADAAADKTAGTPDKPADSAPASQPAEKPAVAVAPTEKPADAPPARVDPTKPTRRAYDWKELVGLRVLAPRPVGRGLTLGVGVDATYFYQRFQSNAFNDPLGNYRLDALLAGLALDAEYHAGFGLILGARLQGQVFSYTEFVPPSLLQLPEPIGNPRRGPGNTALACGQNYPLLIMRQVCPLVSTVQRFSAWTGWRLYGSPELDMTLRVAYMGEFIYFGKPASREPFADLWYHGLRPSARLLYRPMGGKFGAFSGEIGMGVGMVVPMVLRQKPGCGITRPCVPQARDVLESTYRLNEETGEMRRTGYARPPFFSAADVRGGYLFEVPFFQVEAAVLLQARYYGVFYSAREGFTKRNRCCNRGYYDRASNIDLYLGPTLIARTAL